MAVDDVAGRRPAWRMRIWWLLALAGVAMFVFIHEGDADGPDLALPVTRGQTGSSSPASTRPATALGVRSARQKQLAGSLARALDDDAKAAEWPSPPEAARRSWEKTAASEPTRLQAGGDPPKTVPDAPFRWIGLWEQPAAASDVPSALVAIIAADRGTRLVQAGDLLEDDWKVDKISREQIELTYLPMHARQTLAMNKK